MIRQLQKHEAIAAVCEARPETDAAILETSLEGWCAVDINGAVLLTKAGEIHVLAKPEIQGKWLTRGVIVRFFDAYLKAYGKAVAQVNADNTKARRFVERLGFKQTHADNDSVRYEMTRCAYAG